MLRPQRSLWTIKGQGNIGHSCNHTVRTLQAKGTARGGGGGGKGGGEGGRGGGGGGTLEPGSGASLQEPGVASTVRV